jgi:glycosyltransferase involved in cell wall biosynthesis
MDTTRHPPFRAPAGTSTETRDEAPTFSVVIAAHNAAETISEAIESVLTQTNPPLQLVVSDDGSTDATAEALAPYSGHLTYVRNGHRGVAAARNAALRIATGEYVAVLDADDAYLAERLEALAELAMARPDLDILCTDALLEHEGRVVGSFGEDCPFAVEDQRAAILERCFCAWPAVRRTTLVAAGGFDESLRTGSDWECAIRLLFRGAVAGLVDEPLYSYRVHGRSLTADRVRTLNDRVAFLEQAARSYALGPTERVALARSLRRQRAALVLTEAEAALRGRTRDARSRALAAARSPGVAMRSRIAAAAAVIAPRTAARALARSQYSRLGRSIPRR